MQLKIESSEKVIQIIIKSLEETACVYIYKYIYKERDRITTYHAACH